MLGCGSLTSAEVGGSEKLHTLVAGQQMRAWTRRGLGCAPGDGDGAQALHKETSGVAGHQDTSLKLAQQALGGLLRAGLGKHHLLHATLGARGLSHQAAVQALHLGLTHHMSTVDEREQQRVVCRQRTTNCTSASPRGPPGQHGALGKQRGAPCKSNVLVLLLKDKRPREGNRVRAGEQKAGGTGWGRGCTFWGWRRRSPSYPHCPHPHQPWGPLSDFPVPQESS